MDSQRIPRRTTRRQPSRRKSLDALIERAGLDRANEIINRSPIPKWMKAPARKDVLRTAEQIRRERMGQQDPAARALRDVLSVINDLIRCPDVGPGLLAFQRQLASADPAAPRRLVESVLGTHPCDRSGGPLAEVVALLLIVEDIATCGELDGWAEMALDGLRNTGRRGAFPPRVPPAGVGARFPAASAVVVRLAEMLVRVPATVLARVRRCRLADCGLRLHHCESFPFYVDRTKNGARYACCASHKQQAYKQRQRNELHD